MDRAVTASLPVVVLVSHIYFPHTIQALPPDLTLQEKTNEMGTPGDQLPNDEEDGEVAYWTDGSGSEEDYED